MPRWPLMLISAPSGPCTMPTVGASLTKSMKFRPLIGRFSTDCSSMSADCSDRVVSIVGVPARDPHDLVDAADREREVDAQRLPDREPTSARAGGLESGELDGDGVGPERQRQSPIAAVAIRHQVPREARGLIARSAPSPLGARPPRDRSRGLRSPPTLPPPVRLRVRHLAQTMMQHDTTRTALQRCMGTLPEKRRLCSLVLASAETGWKRRTEGDGGNGFNTEQRSNGGERRNS